MVEKKQPTIDTIDYAVINMLVDEACVIQKK